ncbi:translational activator of GCN4, partial [Dispira parvispora]
MSDDLPLSTNTSDDSGNGFSWSSWVDEITVEITKPLLGADRLDLLGSELTPKITALGKRLERTGSNLLASNELQPSATVTGRLIHALLGCHLQPKIMADRGQAQALFKAGKLVLGTVSGTGALAMSLYLLLQRVAQAQHADMGLVSLQCIKQCLELASEDVSRFNVQPAWLAALSSKPAKPGVVCLVQSPAPHRAVLLQWSLLLLELLGQKLRLDSRERLDLNQQENAVVLYPLFLVTARVVAALLYGLVAGGQAPAYVCPYRWPETDHVFTSVGDPQDPDSTHANAALRTLKELATSGAVGTGELAGSTKQGLLDTSMRRVWRWLRSCPQGWNTLLNLGLCPTSVTSGNIWENPLRTQHCVVDLVLVASVVSTAARYKQPLPENISRDELQARFSGPLVDYLVSTVFVDKQAIPVPVLAATADMWTTWIGPDLLYQRLFPHWEKLVLRSADTMVPSLAAILPFLTVDTTAVWTGPATQGAAKPFSFGQALLSLIRTTDSGVRCAWLQLATMTAGFAGDAEGVGRLLDLFSHTATHTPGLGPDHKAWLWSIVELLAVNHTSPKARYDTLRTSHQLLRKFVTLPMSKATEQLESSRWTDRSFASIRAWEPLLAKETVETVAVAMLQCYANHTLSVISDALFLDSHVAEFTAWWPKALAWWNTSLSKTDKPALRRQWAHTIGDITWWMHQWYDAVAPADASSFMTKWPQVWRSTLQDPLWKSLQSTTKKLIASPLASPAGPTEGYVAAITAGVVERVTNSSDKVSQSDNHLWPTVLPGWVSSNILPSKAKPTTIMTERVYGKLTLSTEVLWLMRFIESYWTALAAAVRLEKTPLAEQNGEDALSKVLETQVGSSEVTKSEGVLESGFLRINAADARLADLTCVSHALVYFCLHPTNRQFRHIGLRTVRALSHTTNPALLVKVLQLAIESWLAQRESEVHQAETKGVPPVTSKASSTDGESKFAAQEAQANADQIAREQCPSRVYQLVMAMFAGYQTLSSKVATERDQLPLLLVDVARILHHPLVSSGSPVSPHAATLVEMYRKSVGQADPFNGPATSSFWLPHLLDDKCPWWANPTVNTTGRFSGVWLSLVLNCHITPTNLVQELQTPLLVHLFQDLQVCTPPPEHMKQKAALGTDTSKPAAITKETPSAAATKPAPPKSKAGSKKGSAKDDPSLLFAGLGKNAALKKAAVTALGAKGKAGSKATPSPSASGGKGGTAKKTEAPTSTAVTTVTSGFYQATLSLFTTLCIVKDDLFVPLVWKMTRQALGMISQPSAANADGTRPYALAELTPTNIDIWKYMGDPAEPVVDVLGRRKGGTPGGSSGGQTTARPTGKSAPGTKKSGPALSKDEQAVVNAQLAKEVIIRERVQRTYGITRRALDLLDSIVRASQWCLHSLVQVGEGEDENLPLHHLMADVVRVLVLDTPAVLSYAHHVVDRQGVQVLQGLSQCLSPRLREYRRLVAIAILRIYNIPGVTPAWCAEALGPLIVRLLYQLYFQASRKPLGRASFALLFPVLQAVVDNQGFGDKSSLPKPSVLAEEDSEYAKEDPLSEQLSLTVYLLETHIPHFATQGELLRKEMATTLFHMMRDCPKQCKRAQTCLVTLAQGMGEVNNVVEQELQAFVDGVLYGDPIIRRTALQALDALDPPQLPFTPELWVTYFDADPDNAELARQIGEDSEMPAPPTEYFTLIQHFLEHPEVAIREAASRALAEAIRQVDDAAGVAMPLGQLCQWYVKLAAPLLPEYDQYGMVIQESLNRPDPWPPRLAIAATLEYIAPIVRQEADLNTFCHLLIQQEALGDREDRVRQGMLKSGLALIEHQAAHKSDFLMSVFDQYLKQNRAGAKVHDIIRQNVVVLYGALARYLPASDPRLAQAVEKLMDSLATPSEAVQRAVAQCLAPLMPPLVDQVPAWVDTLSNMLYKAPKYAQRRGGAFGIAGIVQGLGIAALKRYNIMRTLDENIQARSEGHLRQGALFLVETLNQTLEQLFEPYTIQLIPRLLECFADSRPEVREAAADAARAFMAHISQHGVRLVLPSLLRGLHDNLWRTKLGSINLLSSMAYCSPGQLSISLPLIIPRLVEVLADSHREVQAASELALANFGEVISNPEILDLVPQLLRALNNPAKYTQTALTDLLHTSFVHYIDPPSLALIVPIARRGLRERSTFTKRQAAQIIGSMVQLTNGLDLAFYLPSLVPILKDILADPVPDTRATVAKALGLLVESLGEFYFPTLVGDLRRVLLSDTTSINRAGAAQGLSEVLAGLGLEHMEEILPEILANSGHHQAAIREGYMSLLIYLPVTFGQRFEPFLGEVLAPIIRGLADESEYVRDASFRAGQIVIHNFMKQAIQLMLPRLEVGLFDVDWQIRNSSVQLIGDLLFKITGLDGNQLDKAFGNIEDVADGEDEYDGEPEELEPNLNAEANQAQGERKPKNKKSKNRGDKSAGVDEEAEEEAVVVSPEECRKRLIEALGAQRRDKVLAALYVARSDIAATVRQSTTMIWKFLVNNTPRTVKDILPDIMAIIMTNLANEHETPRRIAARTLGDLVRKLGESILHKVIPILNQGLASDQTVTMRQGACIGLSEAIATMGRSRIDDHVDSIVPVLRTALCDPESPVREAAAVAFDRLQKTLGPAAVEQVVPHLLNELANEKTAPAALEALRELTLVRANAVFPVLIPRLIESPITLFKARALASLVAVAGHSLNRRLDDILTALLTSLMTERNKDTVTALREAIGALVGSITDDEGLHALMMILFEHAKDDQPVATRVECCWVLSVLCSTNKDLDYTEFVEDWVQYLLPNLAERDLPDLLQASWDALAALLKTVDKEELVSLVEPSYRVLSTVTDTLPTGSSLPGFDLPKGLGPLLPMFSQGLMFGAPEVREAAASAMRLLVVYTSADHLRAYITQITGPLIRIVGDRHPPNVKGSILSTLHQLLVKAPMFLRPFFPQLQRTFVKALAEPAPEVHKQALPALATLVTVQPRVDPLIVELCNIAKQGDLAVRTTMLKALTSVLKHTKTAVSAASLDAVNATFTAALADPNLEIQEVAAQGVGQYYTMLGSEEALATFSKLVSGTGSSVDRTTMLLVCQAVVQVYPELVTADLADKIV